jgi:hypothetical protein
MADVSNTAELPKYWMGTDARGSIFTRSEGRQRQSIRRTGG